MAGPCGPHMYELTRRRVAWYSADCLQVHEGAQLRPHSIQCRVFLVSSVLVSPVWLIRCDFSDG